jgi:hypothetical protein
LLKDEYFNYFIQNGIDERIAYKLSIIVIVAANEKLKIEDRLFFCNHFINKYANSKEFPVDILQKIKGTLANQIISSQK